MAVEVYNTKETKFIEKLHVCASIRALLRARAHFELKCACDIKVEEPESKAKICVCASWQPLMCARAHVMHINTRFN